MIKIKTHFTNWTEVDIKTATSYVKYLMSHIVTMNDTEKETYINKNRISGITVEQLLRR